MRIGMIAGVAGVAVGGMAAGAFGQSFIYAAEDGGTSDSSLSQFDANATWGNYFFAQPGFERISAIQVAFARNFADAGRSVELLVYDDADNDGDPTNATLVSRTTAGAILTADGEPAEYAINAVDISGGFFIAINMDALQGEPVFRSDFNLLDPDFTPSTTSWTFYNPVGTPQLDLGSSLFVGFNGDFGLGTWVVRAVGVPSPGAIGVLGVAGVMVGRRRR